MRGGDDAGELRAAADAGVDRGAGVRGGDREGAEQAGGEVGGAEAHHLAVGVDRVAAALAEAARRDDAGGEADEENRGGADQELVGGGATRGRERERGQARRDVADDGDAVAAEVEERGEQDCETDHHDGPGNRQPRDACPLQNAEHGDGEGEGRPVDQAGLADELDEGRKQAVGVDVDPGDAPELADQDRERDAGEEADEDRPRQEGGEDAEAEQAGADVEAADDEGEQGGDGGAVGGLEAGHGREDRGHDGDGGGVGADHELPGRAEDRVGDQRRDRGIEPGLRRQAGDRRVGDRARQADRGDGEAGRDVSLQPGEPVALEARQDRPVRERVARGHGSTAARHEGADRQDRRPRERGRRIPHRLRPGPVRFGSVPEGRPSPRPATISVEMR